jgi:Icc-related predicted phosphoesterase
MIRVAAFGDVHAGTDSVGSLRPHLGALAEQADVLLVAGDLTKVGEPEEAAVLAGELADLGVPVVAVLGNHDHHADNADQVTAVLEDHRIRVLEGDATVVDLPGGRLGVAGAKGFGGGFAGASGSDFGEPEMKAFVRHTKAIAGRLHDTLAQLDVDQRVVLLHYAPIADTLQGERLEIYPFLGSYLLGEAVDRAGADLVLHGHAHRGNEKGVTPGGIHVRNVAHPVIQAAYRVYCLGDGAVEHCEEVATLARRA